MSACDVCGREKAGTPESVINAREDSGFCEAHYWLDPHHFRLGYERATAALAAVQQERDELRALVEAVEDGEPWARPAITKWLRETPGESAS